MLARLLFTTIFLQIVNTTQAQYIKPIQKSDGWQVNHLDSVGINKSPINNLLNELSKNDHKIHSMLIVKNGELLFESYFNKQKPTQQHDLRSATKSIISILLGIAIEQGFVDHVDDPINKYLGEYYDIPEDKSQVKIYHLLTMSTGWDCNDMDRSSKGQEDRVYKKKNWIQYTLDLAVLNQPGEVSAYCSMGTVLAAEIIYRSSGMKLPVFAQKYLFDPLNISNAKWAHTSTRHNIPSSALRLHLTSRDFAKIAQLMINDGEWNNQQIISPVWIKKSTSYKTKIRNIEYGFYWWRFPYHTPYGYRVGITATGNGGQYLMIFPSDELAFVFTGGAYNSNESKLPFQLVNQTLLPIFSK